MYVLAHSFSPSCDVSVLFSKDRAERIFIERRDAVLPDTVFLGRVTQKKGNAFFVDIGEGRSGFLQTPVSYVNADGKKMTSRLFSGAVLFVRCLREAFDTKELKLSAYVDVTDDILENAKNKNGYGTVYRPPSLLEQALVTYRPRGVVCDSPNAAVLVKRVLPEAQLRVSLESVWETSGIADALEEAVSCCNVPLPSGGSLVIEETSACVCIDVNTGKDTRSPFEVNLEACEEILRQIRLRSLGGQIVVDFAGKKKSADLRRFCDILKKSTDVRVFGATTLGLVEMTVTRRLASVQSHFYRQVREKTDETVAESLLRRLWFAIVANNEPVCVTASKGVTDLLKTRLAPYLSMVEERLGCPVVLKEGEKRTIKGIK